MRRFSRLAAAVWVSFAMCAAARGGDAILQASNDDTPVSLLDEGVCDCDCEYCDNFQDKPRFLGIIASDHCFDRFISPLSNPFFFEDPRSLTEVRGLYIYNETPAAIGGFNMQAGTAQVRARLSERFSLIAPRIGYWQSNNFLGPRGFMSAPVGFKYNLVRDVEGQFLLSAGATFSSRGPPSRLPILATATSTSFSPAARKFSVGGIGSAAPAFASRRTATPARNSGIGRTSGTTSCPATFIP